MNKVTIQQENMYDHSEYMIRYNGVLVAIHKTTIAEYRISLSNDNYSTKEKPYRSIVWDWKGLSQLGFNSYDHAQYFRNMFSDTLRAGNTGPKRMNAKYYQQLIERAKEQ